MKARPAPSSPRFAPAGQLGLGSFLILGLLLAVPVYALSRLASWIDWRALLGVPMAISIFGYLAQRSDKRRAESGAWRIPEATLHLVELLGGWPGAFLAQRNYRHKTSKLSYQFIFWAVVLIHEIVAVDSVRGWPLMTQLLRLAT